MNSRASLCRSDSKVRNPMSRINAARCSLQVENPASKRQRSSSLDFRARSSGSTSKPRSSSDERKSGLFSGKNSNRKSSINLEGGKTTKEFRPLNDKAYQKKKLTELIEFLNESGYPHPVNISKLLQPSKKDFENIFQFLVRIFDPNFEVKKLEEDGPRMLKTLLYPFIPTKSAFMYVARTNWPPLLGVLLYLLDLAKFAINSDENSFYHNAEFERPEEQAILNEYIFTKFTHNDEVEESPYDESEKEIFAKIIKSRCPYDIEELIARREILRQELEHIEKEVECVNALKVESQNLDHQLQVYDKYFVEMRKHIKKKEDICQGLEKVASEKESELQGLQEVLAQKRALYDAQGYDGKKEKSYFNIRMKEFAEELEAKEREYQELQNESGEIQIQIRQAMDKGAATCETFNKDYSAVTDAAHTILAPLQPLKNAQVKQLLATFSLDFPDCNMQPNQRCVVQWSSARRTSLEEVKQKCDRNMLIFKGLAATQNEKLHEVTMKKSEVAVRLNLVSSEETQRELEINSKGKQALEDISSVESECNAMIKKLEVVQAERIKVEQEYNAQKEELSKIEDIKRERQQNLNHYLSDQKNHFAKWKKDIEEFEQFCQESGAEICATVEKAVNKKKRC